MPATPTFTVSPNVCNGGSGKDLTLYNEKGETVKKFDVADAKAKNYFKQSKTVRMNVKDLPSGTYYLHVRVGDYVNKERISVKPR